MLSRNNTLSIPRISGVLSRAPGKSIAQGIGSQITAAGNNAAAMTATVFLTTAIVAISGRSIGFGSQRRPFAVYGGSPRFQYEGYWITIIDPWPEYWSNDWYDNDDVYVAYGNDGYYMYNRRYPRHWDCDQHLDVIRLSARFLEACTSDERPPAEAGGLPVLRLMPIA